MPILLFFLAMIFIISISIFVANSFSVFNSGIINNNDKEIQKVSFVSALICGIVFHIATPYVKKCEDMKKLHKPISELKTDKVN